MAYNADVSAKQLLSGSVDPPSWASYLIKTLENCTGIPGNHKWVNDDTDGMRNSYAFGSGVASPRGEHGPLSKIGSKKKPTTTPFPPPSWGRKKDSGSYFDSDFPTTPANMQDTSSGADALSTAKFATHFEDDFFSPNEEQTRSNHNFGFSPSASVDDPFTTEAPFQPYDFTQSPKPTAHSRSMSAQIPFSKFSSTNPFPTSSSISHQRSFSLAPPYIKPKPELVTPLSPEEGVARAIALYNFQAVEVRIKKCSLLPNRLAIVVENIIFSPAICHFLKAMLLSLLRRATAVTIGMLPLILLRVTSYFLKFPGGRGN